MNLTRPLLFLGAIILAVGAVVVAFGDKAGQHGSVNPQATLPLDAALEAKAQEHCWFSAKSRAKVPANGPLVTSTGASAQRIGDLIIVTGAMEPAVGDNHFYGCALYEYSQGSPVVVSTKLSASPLRAESVVPFGFSPDGRKQADH